MSTIAPDKRALVFDRSLINVSNIPGNLRADPNWAFYCDKKYPIKLGAVARGWPISGWNHNLTGAAAKAGARSNDPNTWGIFDDCYSLWYRDLPRIIYGPTYALQAQLATVVIDLDDPERSLRDKRAVNGGPLSEGLKQQLIEAAKQSQAAVLELFTGHYIERSVSGKGYHIFVRGTMPQGYERCRFSFHGSVFTLGQFVNMTGHLDARSGVRNGEDLADGSWALKHFINAYSALGANVDKTDILLAPVARDDDPKVDDDGDAVEYLMQENYVLYGRRVDLDDAQVVGKLSKGMQAVWDGGSISGDHSGDTFHLLGDLEKITGNALQIERLMKSSPRMQGAGIGNDGQSRWEKHFRLFNRNLLKVRRDNDRQFVEWERRGTLISWERKEQMRLAFERLTSEDDPGSLAHKERVKREKEEARIEAARLYGEQMTLRAAERKADKEGRRAGGLETGRYTIMAVKAVRLLSEELGLEQEGYFVEDLVPPGLTGELCLAVYEGMYEPFIKFAIPATFAGLAGIVARKFKTSAGHGLHIFAVLLALPTIGKTQAIDAFRDLDNSLLPHRHHRERCLDVPVASRQGFHATLEHGCFTWVRDECKPQLRQILAPQRHDAVSENMQSLANQMFDLGKYKGAPYRPSVSIRATKDGDRPVPNLCVSTFWGTTKDNAAEFLTPDNVNSGIISRMLIVSHLKAGGKFTPGRRVLDSLDSAGELARNLIELHTTADSLDVRYLYEPGKDASGNELPRDLDKDVVAKRDLVLVPLSEEARVFWDRLQVNISEFKGLVANGESMFPKYYLAFGRAGMIAHRIASIMAVLEYGGGHDRDGVVRELKVELHQFKYAIGYVLTVLGGMVSDFDTGESGATGADLPEVGIRVIKNCARKAIREAIATGGVATGAADGEGVVSGSWTGYLKYSEVSAALRNDRAIRNEADPMRKVNALLQELADGGLIEYQRFDSNGRVIGKTGNIQLLPHRIWDDLYI